jgi:ferritin
MPVAEKSKHKRILKLKEVANDAHDFILFNFINDYI